MTGNVWELCSDWYSDYPLQPETNPGGPASGIGKVMRGGAYDDYSYYCTVTSRWPAFPNEAFGGIFEFSKDLGFRLVKE